jgi:hypothetical protein
MTLTVFQLASKVHHPIHPLDFSTLFSSRGRDDVDVYVTGADVAALLTKIGTQARRTLSLTKFSRLPC